MSQLLFNSIINQLHMMNNSQKHFEKNLGGIMN